ncbi:glycosyltransferase [Agromyces sp. NPDC056523]|uniref:glycosyltransferase n=1 Tax=Agromyces sp. NPDC056523 TaxID=3345850 RepID=UPI00366B4D86
MPRYLLCSTPIQGHVAPMLAIGRRLVERGHVVTMITGTRFRGAVEGIGAEHRPLKGAADYDDQTLQEDDEEGQKLSLRLIREGMETIFVLPIPEQADAISRAMDDLAPDAILVDSAFMGVIPFLLDAPATRPPVLAAGVVPLSQSSADVGPIGLGLPPATSMAGRLRNRALNALLANVVFRPVQQLADRILEDLGRPPLDIFVFDFSRLFDRFLQLSPPEFEYPRRDLSANVRFVGTVLPAALIEAPLPGWWSELDDERPVVHVSQGTIDNHDFGLLVGPTLEALARTDVLVVAATGGRPIEELGSLPTNARAAEFLPYDLLFPKTDVFVTNAGFGGVQYALSHGVPVVAAGAGADKPDVAMRVQWSGVGLNLKTGRPTPDAIRSAVDRLLGEPGFRLRARELAAHIAELRTLDVIEEELATAVSARRSS